MMKRILTYGLLAGAIVGTIMSSSTLLMKDNPPPLTVGLLIGYSSMLVALSVIFVAVKRQRDEVHGGVIKFVPAFMMGLGISVIAGVIYVLAWEFTMAVSGMDYIGGYADMMIEEAQAKGASEAEIAKLSADMAAMQESYANPMYRLPMTFSEIFPVGILVSLIVALVLRNSRFLPARPAS